MLPPPSPPKQVPFLFAFNISYNFCAYYEMQLNRANWKVLNQWVSQRLPWPQCLHILHPLKSFHRTRKGKHITSEECLIPVSFLIPHYPLNHCILRSPQLVKGTVILKCLLMKSWLKKKAGKVRHLYSVSSGSCILFLRPLSFWLLQFDFGMPALLSTPVSVQPCPTLPCRDQTLSFDYPLPPVSPVPFISVRLHKQSRKIN